MKLFKSAVYPCCLHQFRNLRQDACEPGNHEVVSEAERNTEYKYFIYTYAGKDNQYGGMLVVHAVTL